MKKKEKKLPLKLIFIILIILLICLLLFFFINYNKQTNKLKRTLIKNNYECNKKICTKKISKSNYSFNYINDSLTVSNSSFILKINEDKPPVLEIREKHYICNYEFSNYHNGDYITKDYTYNKYCEQYIKQINEIIKNRNEIYKQSKVSL